MLWRAAAGRPADPHVPVIEGSREQLCSPEQGRDGESQARAQEGDAELHGQLGPERRAKDPRYVYRGELCPSMVHGAVLAVPRLQCRVRGLRLSQVSGWLPHWDGKGFSPLWLPQMGLCSLSSPEALGVSCSLGILMVGCQCSC